MFVGGRQFSVIGLINTNIRTTFDYRLNTNYGTAAFVPLVSMRRKATFATTSIKVSGTDIITNKSSIVRIIFGATLTGAEWGNIIDQPPAETSMESDKSATSYTGGVIMWTSLIAADGRANSNEIASINVNNVDLPHDQIMTLAIISLDGAAVVATSLLSVQEEF